MESGFGQSFSDVSIVPESNNVGSAHAVTRGNTIEFASGQFQPETPRGDWLIGHELAHVVQQRGGSPSAQAFAPGSDAGMLEMDADRAADAVMNGQRAEVALTTTSGTPQAYEAWEHRELGDSQGGGARTITLNCGVTITFGEAVALSGDFYRSPEALMNASAEEINELRAIMARERSEVDRARAAGEDPNLAPINADYDLATSKPGGRAHHHDHSGLLDEHDHGREHRHGVSHDGEHLEDGGEGAAIPGADDSMFGLADVNSSHFAPEAIKLNYKPKHGLALELAKGVWTSRNPSAQAAPSAAGTAPSTRQPADGHAPLPGEQSPTEAITDLPINTADPTKEGSSPGGGGATNSSDSDQAGEAQAYLSEAFANHFLTDAFASGHLVSGNVGRSYGGTFFDAHSAQIAADLAACASEDSGLPVSATRYAVDKAMPKVQEKAPSLALKMIHDKLNQDGVQVRNAAGAEWRTLGDGRLHNSPATRQHAEASVRTSRDSVDDVLSTGGSEREYQALDHIPDVAKLGEVPYRPIEQFATDIKVFDSVYTETMLGASPNSNRLYRTAKGYVVPMASLEARRFARDKAHDIGEQISSGVDQARQLDNDIWDWGAARWESASETVSGWEQVASEKRDAAQNWGSERLTELQDTYARVRDSVTSAPAEARRIASEAAATGRRNTAGAAQDAADWIGEHVGGSQPDQLTTGDQAIIELDNQTYAHGAFMGAAGAFMSNSHWMAIFETLMPTVYARISAITDNAALMTALENNPVIAAYGSAQVLSEDGASEARPSEQHKALPLEWDIFLDPDPANVRDLNTVRIAHGGLGTTVGQGIAGDQDVSRARADVANAPSGAGWMEIFGRAIRMHRGDAASERDPDQADNRADALGSINDGTSAGEAIAACREFLGPPHGGGLILDVKSTYSTPDDIANFVEAVQAEGIAVIGVGTFKHGQLDELAARDSTAGIHRVKFYHGLNGLENAADADPAELVQGDEVMFNAGSLLTREREGILSGEYNYSVDRDAYQRLAAIQAQYGLNIGLYVQETAVAPGAVEAITALVNAYAHVFTRGFAYGNVSGHAETQTEGDGLGSQGMLNTWDGL